MTIVGGGGGGGGACKSDYKDCFRSQKCEKIYSENRPILVIYAVNPSKALKGGL